MTFDIRQGNGAGRLTASPTYPCITSPEKFSREENMVDVIAKAKLSEVIWAQLDADGDLYDEIMEICRRANIQSGVVLSIVGGLRKARLSMPVRETAPEPPPRVSAVP